MNQQRLVWTLTGLVAGLGIAQFWPHEPVAAGTSDRDAKFGMVTCPVSGSVEGVFVLDFLTGQLKGALYDPRQGGFNRFYYRNLALDFQVDPSGKPAYAIVSGVSGQGAVGRTGSSAAPSSGTIYVAEMTSGTVAAYTAPYTTRATPKPIEMPVLGTFPFRAPTIRD